MHLGRMTSVLLTREDLKEVGTYDYDIDVPDELLPSFDRRGFFLTWIEDCFRQAAYDTGLPVNEGIWTFTPDPTASIIYSLAVRYRS